jgi:hypothetical protein
MKISAEVLPIKGSMWSDEQKEGEISKDLKWIVRIHTKEGTTDILFETKSVATALARCINMGALHG